MATFLLSISAHVVFSHAPPLRTVTRLKVESSSPIRLTQSGPLAVRYSSGAAPCGRTPISAIGSLRVRAYPKAAFYQSLSLPAEATSLLLS